MVVLTADQIGKISNLLANAFTQAELAPLVLVTLKMSLGSIANTDQVFEGIVFDLVTWANRRGRPTMIALLQGAVTAKANDPELWAFCENAFTGEIRRLDSGELVERVNRGIEALVILKDLPVVQQTVGQFRADFEAASKQIQILKRYKSLHDGLHRLQMMMRTIEDEIEAAKKNQRAARSLAKHAIELAPLARKARHQAQCLSGATIEIAWISDYDNCITTMNRASSQVMSPDDLCELADGLNRLLPEAARINSLLATVASTLPLENLVHATGEIAKHIQSTADPRDERTQHITGDLTALGLLQPQLVDLVAQHFECQWVDKELAGAAKLFSDEHGPAAKMPQKKWSEFRDRFMQLCTQHPQDIWSRELKDRLLLWERSPLSSPPTKDEADASDSSFDEFCSACAMHFFEVDDELHELCTRLTQLATPLNTLLLVIK